MAYALVGSFGTATTTSGTSVTPAYAQATSAGNLLVGWIVSDGTSTISTSASGWVGASSQQNPSSAIFYRPNSGAGETAPTFTCTGGSTVSACLAEFSGGATSSPVDQNNVNSSVTTPCLVFNNVADVALGELVCVVCFGVHSKAGTATTSHTFNNGATSLGNANNDATSTGLHFRFSYGITTGNSAADQSSAADSGMNLTAIYGEIVSFLLASTARVPRNSAINHQNPAVLMEGMEQDKRNHLWLPKRWRSRIEIPRPVFA